MQKCILITKLLGNVCQNCYDVPHTRECNKNFLLLGSSLTKSQQFSISELRHMEMIFDSRIQ